MGGCATPHAPKQEPQTQATNLLEEGTFEVWLGEPGKGPVALSLHPL